MSLNLRPYLWYKFFNSLFFGMTVGCIFVLYTPLEPSVFSLGGILLAIGLLLVAKAYEKMMNLLVFYYVTLGVELLTCLLIIALLQFNVHYSTALFIYGSYQLTFVFGNYLMRVETLVLKRSTLLSFADVMKQKGYLWGMVLSYIFYKALEYFDITDKQLQVYNLHFILLPLQLGILYTIFRAFRLR